VQSRDAIAQEWLGRIRGAGLLAVGEPVPAQLDPFRNPVGYTLRQAVGILLDELFSTMDAERVRAALDSIVQIRAVEDLTPAHALEFLFQLKSILRKLWGRMPSCGGLPIRLPGPRAETGPAGNLPHQWQAPDPDLDLLFGRIDELALLAFDLYVKYRERTFEARAHEARRRVFVLERRFEMQEAK